MTVRRHHAVAVVCLVVMVVVGLVRLAAVLRERLLLFCEKSRKLLLLLELRAHQKHDTVATLGGRAHELVQLVEPNTNLVQSPRHVVARETAGACEAGGVYGRVVEWVGKPAQSDCAAQPQKVLVACAHSAECTHGVLHN